LASLFAKTGSHKPSPLSDHAPPQQSRPRPISEGIAHTLERAALFSLYSPYNTIGDQTGRRPRGLAALSIPLMPSIPTGPRPQPHALPGPPKTGWLCAFARPLGQKEDFEVSRDLCDYYDANDCRNCDRILSSRHYPCPLRRGDWGRQHTPRITSLVK